MPTPATAVARDVWTFAFNNVIGCLAGLLWCYIVVIQFDPRQECPAPGCWRVVFALLAWAVAGVVGMPWVSVQVMRSLRASPEAGATTYGETRALPAFLKRLELERETRTWARELLARSTGTAWSVGLYAALSSCVRQLEYDALLRRAGGGSCDGASLGCALEGVLYLAACVGSIALATSLAALLATGLASRALGRGNLAPLLVEMLLMLRSNVYYSVAYTWCTTLGLLWFAPYELGPAADNALSPAGSWSDGGVRAAFAAARALTLAGLFGRLALVSLGDVPTDDDVEATRGAPWGACARLLVFRASAVTVAIVCNDVAQGLIGAGAGAFSLRELSAGLAYAALLLALGLGFLLSSRHATTLRRRASSAAAAAAEDEAAAPKRSKSDERLPLAAAAADAARRSESKEWRFARLLYNWLVIFATWAPWKRFILHLYAALAARTGPVLLLPCQIALALGLTLALALFSALLHKGLTRCCGAFDDGGGAYDELPDEPEGNPFV